MILKNRFSTNHSAIICKIHVHGLSELISEISKNIFIPITVGGGIRNILDIKNALRSGADKVSINTAAIKNTKFISEAVSEFGSSTISIAIEADQREFQLYKSGIFTGQCGAKLDHGVLVVGYGPDYYLVKNSWSTSWGDGGYIKLGLGPEFNNGDGQCGMLLQGSFPKL